MSDVTSKLAVKILALKKIISALYLCLEPDQRAKLDGYISSESLKENDINHFISASSQREIKAEVDEILSHPRNGH